jgi:hypothetical protein
LPPQEINTNDIWISGIAKVGCVLEVFDAIELVLWCIDKYEKNQRIIQLHEQSLISLGPSTFKNMLKLAEPTMAFKVNEAK